MNLLIRNIRINPRVSGPRTAKSKPNDGNLHTIIRKRAATVTLAGILCRRISAHHPVCDRGDPLIVIAAFFPCDCLEFDGL